MIEIGTAGTRSARKLLLLGSGELGKEVAIYAQRLGVEVIACDRYANAPAMQVAHRSHVFPMLDGEKLREIVEKEQPDLIVPEIEAIATETLIALEAEGHRVIPTARAARLTMDREGIRRLAAEELSLPTSPYRFAESAEEALLAARAIGFPCVMKPVMSSSGKGQRTIHNEGEVEAAYQAAIEGTRAKMDRVIVEGFVAFDYEITLLTVRHRDGTSFCPPIGHRQVRADYRESWQPQPMSDRAREASEAIALAITDSLGGRGVFGVELFIRGDEAIFSEVSPRPHDTGMVTMISQDLSEFELHVRAILDLPIPHQIVQLGPSASHVVLAQGTSEAPRFRIDPESLREPGTDLRLFGKPTIDGERRLGVALARGASLDEARQRAAAIALSIEPILE